jgi:hypothetical protein
MVVRFLRATAGSRLLRAILNDWVYSGTYQAHTGRPFSVLINNDSALDCESNQRAALVPGANPILGASRHRTAKVAEYFNRDAFTYPKVATFSPMQQPSSSNRRQPAGRTRGRVRKGLRSLPNPAIPKMGITQK